jgi:UDP-3-O-[3-hydroxymyristoyl] glucosamine N-acyltransferase
MAGCCGLAGSVTLGKRCILGGGVGIADHITITDDVTVLGMSMVTHDILKSGVYSGGWGAQPAGEWRRQVAGLRSLDDLRHRVRDLEKLAGKRGKS